MLVWRCSQPWSSYPIHTHLTILLQGPGGEAAPYQAEDSGQFCWELFNAIYAIISAGETTKLRYGFTLLWGFPLHVSDFRKFASSSNLFEEHRKHTQQFDMCQGLNYHYFHIIGHGHQPNSRDLYTHYKDSLLKVGGFPSPIQGVDRPWLIYYVKARFMTSLLVFFPWLEVNRSQEAA